MWENYQMVNAEFSNESILWSLKDSYWLSSGKADWRICLCSQWTVWPNDSRYFEYLTEISITCSGVRRRLMALVVFDLSSMGTNLVPATFSLNFDLDNWLWTVKTRAIDFLTEPIFESLAGAPPVTWATRSCVANSWRWVCNLSLFQYIFIFVRISTLEGY